MHFPPYDLTYAALEASIILAIRTPIPADDLKLAASRLLESWPMLSYRLNRTHTTVTETPATSINDGFFTISTAEPTAGSSPYGYSVVNGVHIYDSTVLSGLFARQKKTWANTFWPHILTIQVVSTPNDTLLKFTMQHVAADVLGLYKAAEAFFEALKGPIAKRSNQIGRQYVFQPEHSTIDEKSDSSAEASSLIDMVSTPLARAWLRNYDPSGLFPLAVAGREWWNQWTVTTRQQMIHIPNEAILRWKGLAVEAGATNVSRFDLVAAWIQSCLADHAAELDPTTTIRERFIIIMNMKRFFLDPRKPDPEFWNPLSPAFIDPLSSSPPSTPTARLIEGAKQIRKAIITARTPAYATDLMKISERLPGRSSQFRGQGGNNPPTLKLTSWSEAPFAGLKVRDVKGRVCEPELVQPGLNYIPSLPIPGSHLHQTMICWQGGEREGGYWLAGNLDVRLWGRLVELP